MSRKVVVVLFLALLVGACGNGEDKPSGAQQDYAAKVDAICKDLQGKVGTLGQDPAKQATDVEDAVNRMKAIEKPRDNSEKADVYIATMENLYLALQDVDQSRRVNDQPRAQRALDTVNMNNTKAAKAAEDYGMKVCSQPLGT